jgi:hypothetical protein
LPLELPVLTAVGFLDCAGLGVLVAFGFAALGAGFFLGLSAAFAFFSALSVSAVSSSTVEASPSVVGTSVSTGSNFRMPSLMRRLYHWKTYRMSEKYTLSMS